MADARNSYLVASGTLPPRWDDIPAYRSRYDRKCTDQVLSCDALPFRRPFATLDREQLFWTLPSRCAVFCLANTRPNWDPCMRTVEPSPF